MARVPTYENFKVGQSAQPFTPVSDPGAGQLAAQAGREQQALGQGMQQAGNIASAIAVDMQDQANQVQLNAAANAARKVQLDLTFDPNTGYRAIKGGAALTRPDGKSLPDEYGDRYKTALTTISDGLGNDAQRRAFAATSGNMMVSFQGDVQSHMLVEFRNHALSTQDGTIKIGIDTAKLYWNDPDKITPALDSVKAAVFEAGRISGESASETTAKMKVATSGAHTGVIETALQNNNPEYALSYLEHNKDGMTADDLLRTRAVVNKDVYARVADGIATTTVTAARTALQPSDGTRMISITRQSESGGNPNAIGPHIPGQGTAKGDMQVMDATAANPGFGIAPADPAKPGDRTRVGEQLITALVGKYAGDPAKAWAAYNAGSGNVDKAIASAGKSGTNWMDALAEFQSPANHKQTVNYVNKNVAALGDGGGAPIKPTLQEVHDNVRAKVMAQYGATPPAGVLKMALDSSTQQFEDLNKAIKAKEDQGVTGAMRALQQNGGRYSLLPSDVRAGVPADKLDTVLSFGQKVARGDDITNPAIYQRLSDPAVLRKLSDDQFFQLRGELSASDFQHFSTQRATGKSANKLEEINMGALNSTLKDRLQTSGLDPTPKDGSADAQRVGAIKKYVVDTMLSQQKTTGKQMTDADVEKHIDGLFAKSLSFRTAFLGIGTGTTSDRMLTMQVGDIPGETSTRLRADFKAAGFNNPTDADLLGAYWRLKSRPTKPVSGQSASGQIKPSAQ